MHAPNPATQRAKTQAKIRLLCYVWVRILPNPSESCSIFPRILRFATMVFGLLLCRKVRIALIAGSQSDQTGEHSEPSWRGESASTSLRPIWLGIK